jgi:hypothetical protein
VIVLGRDGRIVEQGRLGTLCSKIAFIADPHTHYSDRRDSELSQRHKQLKPAKIFTQSETDETNMKVRLDGDLKIYAYYAKAIGWILALSLRSSYNNIPCEISGPMAKMVVIRRGSEYWSRHQVLRRDLLHVR